MLTIKSESNEEMSSLLKLNCLLNLSPLNYLSKDNKYSSRLVQELRFISQSNQVENILLAYRIKEIISSFNIPFFIRGSAGGSLLLYLLGFTSIDPVRYNILFERFMNSYRDTLGDIDFDLPLHLRDKVMEKVYQTLKKEGMWIGRLCTKVYYKENSSIREAIRRVYNYHHNIPREIFRDNHSLKEFLKNKCGSNLEKVLKKSNELKGKLRYISSHVGGITIMNDKEKEEWIYSKRSPVPLIKADKNDIDKQMRFKIDLLSNTGLDILHSVYPGKKLDESTFPYKKEVFEMIGRGDTIGILYAESPLMIQTLKEYHSKYIIKDISDIAKCLSIIRPSNRGEGKGSDLIFDDDWIYNLSKLINIPLEEADKKRRILAKESRAEKGEFLTKLKKIVSPVRLRQLMQIKCYGFCKAHATNYAQLIYCQAYAKYHKPTEFFCAVLNSLDGRIYHSWVYFFESLRKGVKIQATKKNDTYKVKNGIIIPKTGVQMRLKSLCIFKELSQFGGFTRLNDIFQIKELIACSRGYKDIIFMTVLENGELKNKILDKGIEV
jgi:DNA polymerase-3 subunit alpha